MAKEEKTLDVAERATMLKKAGFSTIVTILILLLSSPGFYNFFLDSTSEEARIEAIKAQAASEIAYTLLKAKSENMESQIATLRQDVKELSGYIHTMLLQQAQVNAGARPGGRRVTAANAPEAPTMPTVEPLTKTVKLPADLDPLVQLQVKETLETLPL